MSSEPGMLRTLPDFICKTQDKVFEFTLVNTNALPVSSTLTLCDCDEVLVDAQANDPGQPTQVSVPQTVWADRCCSEDLLEVWEVTLDTGEILKFRRQAFLCHVNLTQTISNAQLVDYHQDLNEICTDTAISRYRCAAWEVIIRTLIQKGNFPHLVLSPYALTDLHIMKTMQLIFRDLDHSLGDGRYREYSSDYRQQYDMMWDNLVLVYDYDKDGKIDGDDEKPIQSSVIFTARPPTGMGGR